ncbi:MAG: site-2 protease family protein [Solirubrobacterales bacterium]|nr:site-2 protease family protein [Solirubrobacterales bacterium]
MQLAKVFGIRIGASPSWFIVLFIMIWALSGFFGDVLDASDTTAYVVAVGAALVFFLSLVLHELGHALVARRNGIGISGIDLWFFGGIAKMTRDTATPGEEFRVAAAGPAVTLLVVALCLGLGALLSDSGHILDAARFQDTSNEIAPTLLGWLAFVNGALFVFNMIPAFPLDGGRIARAAAWKVTGDRTSATRISGRLGQVFSYVLIGGGLFLAFSSDPAGGLYLAVLGWFLGQAARGAVAASEFSERIEGVTAEDLMEHEPVAVPGTASALAAQEEFFLRYRVPWFPVVDAAGRLLGRLREERVDGAVAGGQPALAVAEMLEPAVEGDCVARDEPLEHLLGSEPLRALGALMVIDHDGRLVGLVTLDRVRRALAAGAAGPLA